MHKLKSEAHQRLSHHFLPGGPRNPNPDPEGNQSNNPLLFFFFFPPSFHPPHPTPGSSHSSRHFPGPCMRTHGGGKGMEEGVETAHIPWRKEWFTRACGEGSDSCLGRTHTHTLTHTRALCLNEKKKRESEVSTCVWMGGKSSGMEWSVCLQATVNKWGQTRRQSRLN